MNGRLNSLLARARVDDLIAQAEARRRARAVSEPARGAERRRPADDGLGSTFVFADLVGYSVLTEQHGDAAAAAIARHFAHTMRALSRKHGARHVKSMGDGVMIQSADPARAVALAAEAVRLVRPLPVRIGVHTGSAVRHRSDWYGSAVNVAARLAAQAGPGEVLVSAATRSAAAGASMDDLGACRTLALRGIGAARPGLQADDAGMMVIGGDGVRSGRRARRGGCRPPCAPGSAPSRQSWRRTACCRAP